jgi:L-threonylcarbamoyladenylate synthase
MKEHSISVQDNRAMLEAIRSLSVGHLAVLPTDTLYGLHGLATTPGMVEKLARAKGYMDGERSFILLAPDMRCIASYARLDDAQRRLLQNPDNQAITFIFRALPDAPPAWTTAGEDGEPRIAFRLPRTPFLGELLTCLNAPLLSTSVNLAGQPPLESAQEIVKLFGDNVDLVISDSDLEERVAREGAVPSTLVDLSCQPPKVLREGRTPFCQVAGAP